MVRKRVRMTPIRSPSSAESMANAIPVLQTVLAMSKKMSLHCTDVTESYSMV